MLSAPTPRAGDVYLPPGLLYAAGPPCVIRTVLGSCVAVCLWSPRLSVGGMNHYMLPRGGGEPEASPRFGETALVLLLARLHALGAATGELEARIYGGASVVPALRNVAHLGEDNVVVARQWLRLTHIPVVDEDVLGGTARRVLFDVATGHAHVTRLGSR
jgi:chemotaxis protein CheD